MCVCVCVCVYVCVFVCTSAYASRYVPPMRTAMTINVPLLKPINYSRSNPRISKTSAGKLSQSLVFCPPVVGVIPLHPPICWPAALGGQTCVCVRVCACVCVCASREHHKGGKLTASFGSHFRGVLKTY